MKKIIIALLGMAVVAIPVFAVTLYVSPSGNDANDGSSWTLAKKTIQAGVNVASVGDTVLVTDGTYVLTDQISISNAITVKSVNGASLTIVNGNYPVTTNLCFVLYHTNAILDGFMITGGYNNNNGDIVGGAGVNGDGTVENCTISGNIGGGVANGPHGTVRNCTISGNTNSSPGIGGGVDNDGTVENCTISGNTATNGVGGVHNDHGIVLNCIMYYNEHGDFDKNPSSYFYSCAPGLSGNGNISSDPQFVDSANGNYRLKYSSPCINTGTNQDWMANAVDLDGNPRIINGRVDMGAYESSNAPVIGPVIKANGQADNVTVSHSSNLTVTVQINPGQYSGINADWWVVALANGSWYYLNSAVQWTPFNGVLANCHPVCQVPLFNLSATPVLSYTGLPVGSYTFWFVITQMDGVLDINEPMLFDSVNVIVQ